jgi:hypothetical protein
MGKSHRRHHKRPKRKSTRRRRRGGAQNSLFSMSSDMSKHLNNAYAYGVKSAQPHVDSMKKMTGDLHNQANQVKDSGKKAYSGFKYSGPTNFAIAKTGESAYSKASKAMQPQYENMKSSMGSSMKSMGSSMKSMGSSMKSMGFSSLSSNQPNVKELEHAEGASARGVPTAYSQTTQSSVL